MFSSIWIAVTLVCSVLLYTDEPVIFGSILSSSSPTEELQTNVVFGGDVLLARAVERTLDTKGTDWPYRAIETLRASTTSIVVNFEAAIPKQHIRTPDLTTSFSVASSHIPALRAAGITHASLANNHALDKDIAGFLNTQKVLQAANITPMGSPDVFASTSVSVIDTQVGQIAIVALNLVFANLPLEISDTLARLSASSTHQIVFVHWGQEYELVHSDRQERIAIELIDAGADMIIGHHPHVVQDIGTYNDRLIFYSLGNLIFDQWFSPAVEQGLVIDLQLEDPASPVIRLLPMTSEFTRTQPQFMPEDQRTVWLQNLAGRSNARLQRQIQAGKIQLTPMLAISP